MPSFALETWFLALNTSVPPFESVAARRALNLHAVESWHLDHNDIRDGYLGVDTRTPPTSRQDSHQTYACGRPNARSIPSGARSVTRRAINAALHQMALEPVSKGAVVGCFRCSADSATCAV